MFNFIKNISPIEIGVIVLILLLFFGSKFVSKLGRASGETFREMKNIKKNFTEALEEDKDNKETDK